MMQPIIPLFSLTDNVAVICRSGLVLMRTQEGNCNGVSTVGITCAAWVLTIIFRPSACIPCLQASTHIVCKLLLMIAVIDIT